MNDDFRFKSHKTRSDVNVILENMRKLEDMAMNDHIPALDARLKRYHLHRPSYCAVRTHGGKLVFILKTPVSQGYKMPHQEFILGDTLEAALVELDKVARRVEKLNGMSDR